MKNFILKFTPIFFQNIAITVFNFWQYRKRHGGKYSYYRRYFAEHEFLSSVEIEKEQLRRLDFFLSHIKKSSIYYRSLNCNKLTEYPVLEKSFILNKLSEISTIDENNAVVSLTGGTTGASMKVLYTPEDIQERHALLDHFRFKFGYKLGSRTAWFSGKDLVRPSDLSKGICYRDDWINKIRFFSTFHIIDKYFDSYWSSLEKFSPEYIVGFPSSVYDLCVQAKSRNLIFNGNIKVFFPTAETVLPQQRNIINEVLGCAIIDQYASSEGAPFILQCSYGSLHIHSLSGIFEVVDENLTPANEGEILVTSFSTRGTPLVRYRIGDRLKLSNNKSQCACGSNYPIVDFIDGRNNDFIFSPQNGRVNLGNISNCTKDAPGIVCFQIVQNDIGSVEIFLVKGKQYSDKDEASFLDALTVRLGSEMKIKISYVDEIAREKSGKFRLVKNTLNL